ncbi:uncharacterized protein V1518DRAFT_392994 [Limtongia smithiae]|uniref:uncharacterized protein n=1 Tax=Limtongia smithiae TaxID=1125753 RepID=UPI0034CDBD78
MVHKRRFELVNPFASDAPDAPTPELDFSGVKRARPDSDFGSSYADSIASPDDASDLFDDIFTPQLSSPLEFDFESVVVSATDFQVSKTTLIGEASAAAAAVLEDDDDGLTTDDEDLSFVSRSSVKLEKATSTKQSDHTTISSTMPLGIQAMGPIVGHWDSVAEGLIPSPACAGVDSNCLPISSPSLGGASRMGQAFRQPTTSQTTTSLDALLEQFVDVNKVADNTVVLANKKFWIDRYMTIPICGYLNRASTASRRTEIAVPATSVAGISMPAGEKAHNNRKRLLKRAASTPGAVYGLKKRSFVLGKGREMVGLGVIVGDLQL